jgi:hypothetical protein
MEEETKSLKTSGQQFTISKPINIEMLNFNIIKNDVEYEFQLTYNTEKWLVKRYLSEIKNYFKSLSVLKYAFLPNDQVFNSNDLEYDSNINLRELNSKVTNMVRYLSYRFDILNDNISKEFFSYSKYSEDISKRIKQSYSIEQIYQFKIDESDMSMSDFIYNSDLGILIISLEDVSFFSRVGRFWSIMDYEILGNFFVFQRLYDENNKPYFRKLVNKNFDTRVSKIELSENKIFVGLDNGAIQIFNINVINSNKNENTNTNSNNKDKIITILEGQLFKYLNERITGICITSDDYLLVSSKENKLLILDFITNNNNSLPEIKFNGSLKKRIQGKGHVCNILVDNNNKRIYVVTVTNKIVVYNIVTYT